VKNDENLHKCRIYRYAVLTPVANYFDDDGGIFENVLH
jgi:hypothetical protein